MALDLDRIQALLFDLDGTLIETDNQMVDRLAVPLGRVAWLFRQPDGQRAARWFVMRAEGPGTFMVSLADRLGLDGPLLSATARLQGLSGPRPPARALAVAGVRAMLDAVRSRYPIALVTTRGHANAHALLAAAGLGDLFAVMATREDTFYMKPNPAPVRFAAQRLGVAPERCLMIGDTTVDILAGRRAGAQTCGVLCGFGELAELVSAGATAVLDDTARLALALGIALAPPQG